MTVFSYTDTSMFTGCENNESILEEMAQFEIWVAGSTKPLLISIRRKYWKCSIFKNLLKTFALIIFC